MSDCPRIHIYRTTGPYIGQVRRKCTRTWKTVTQECATLKAASIQLMHEIDRDYDYFRVLQLDDSGYQPPIVCMEGKL